MRRVLTVLSRDYDQSPESGRKTIIGNWIRTLEKHHDVQLVILTLAHEEGYLTLLWTLLVGLLKGEALQVRLYTHRANLVKVTSYIEKFKPDYIYIDGGRISPLVRLALKRAGKIGRVKVIVDIDDMMSRRYRLHQEAGLGLQMGFLGSGLSKLAGFSSRWMAKPVLSREARKMARIEREVLDFADDVIFSSEFERTEASSGRRGGSARLHRHVIGYEMRPIYNLCEEELTFCFVGSDRIPQNRLSIQTLTRIWNTHKITHRLLIIGVQYHQYPLTENVEFLGFVPDLTHVLAKSSAAIVFSELRGGIKTKIPEVMACGIPVIINDVAREGTIGLQGYDLCFDEAELVQFLRGDADEIRSALRKASETCFAVAEQFYSREKLEALVADIFPL